MEKQNCNNQSYLTSINNNDSLSLLKGLDLKQLLVELKKFEPHYRYDLGFLKEMTFGVEMEYEGSSPEEIDSMLGKSSCYNWISKDEETSTKLLSFEVNSPILKNIKNDYLELRTACRLLRKNKVYTSEETASQCHFGAQSIATTDSLLNLLLIWCNYEDEIYRFGYGETKKPRSVINMYAKSIVDIIKQNYDILKRCHSFEELVHYLKKIIEYKEYGINFKNIVSTEQEYGNTIEFRNANSILDEILWQSLISLYGNLIISSSGIIDREKLEYDLMNKEIITAKNIFKEYQKLDVKKSLEFVDIIFKNNQDKAFFLNYYFGKEEIINNLNLQKQVYIKR